MHIAYHFYADDTQIYLPLIPGYNSCANSLTCCLPELKVWLSKHFLRLIAVTLSTIRSDLEPLALFQRPQVKLNFLQLRLLTKVSQFLKLISFFKDQKKAIHAFITSSLDLCNLLNFGLNKTQTADRRMKA